MSPVTPSSWIELSASALRSNVRYLRKQIGARPVLSCVVKANAYGHSIPVFVPLAESCGIRHFSVYSASEAEAVLACRTEPGQLLIMGAIDEGDLEWAVEHDIAFFVSELLRLRGAERAARRVGKAARIHLEVETGMHRTGLSARGLAAAARRCLAHPGHLALEGVCTHFAGAESSANYKRVMEQIQVYRDRIRQLHELGARGVLRHAASSAATFSFPGTIDDLVRVGIALYGFWPSPETRMQHLKGQGLTRPTLRRVLSWHSRVVNLKTVSRGAFIGYGTSYLSMQRMRVAVVPVGYHDGFDRGLSNRGHVLIGGCRCPVVGMVNMNMLTVDVTHLDSVAPGDPVVIIGRQGDDEITVSAFGAGTNDLNYEILARLDRGIDRVVVE
jgi:alanine racemase